VSISRLVCAKLHSYKGYVSDFEMVRNDPHQDLFLAIQLTQLPIWWVVWLLPGYKTVRAWSRPLTPHSSAKVTKEGTYTCTPPICLRGVDSDSKDKAEGMGHKIIWTNIHFLLKMGIFSLAITISKDLSSELGHHSTWLICTYNFSISQPKDIPLPNVRILARKATCQLYVR